MGTIFADESGDDSAETDGVKSVFRHRTDADTTDADTTDPAETDSDADAVADDEPPADDDREPETSRTMMPVYDDGRRHHFELED